jgi:Zinc finger, C3HC4 type (RING finger)
MSDFGATCRHLERRRKERLSAGAIIPGPEMPSVLPQRLDSATTEPGKLMEVEASPPSTVGEAEHSPDVSFEEMEVPPYSSDIDDPSDNAESTATTPCKLMEEEAPPTASMDASELSLDVSSVELEVPPCATDFDVSSDGVECTNNLGEDQADVVKLGSYEASVPEGGVCEEVEEEPTLTLKRVSHGSEEDLAKKRRRDTDDADNTSELYAQAKRELARASDLRREAEEFRKHTEAAHEAAAQLQCCTQAAHEMAEEQLRIAMESQHRAEQLELTNKGIEKQLQWLRKEAETDRLKASTLEGMAQDMLKVATDMQEKAIEDRRLAAELLSAVEEQKRLLTEVPKETENDRRKAKEMLAEIEALWEKTAHQVAELSVNVQQVSQQVQQSSDKPPEIFLDDDPVLPQVPYFEWNLPTHPPDERGIRHNVTKEVVINGPYLNVALQDTAVTAPHGTLPPGPTMCLTCCDHLATCVIVPCGHAVLCGPCGSRVQSVTKVCPVCTRGAYDMNGKLIVLKLFSC